MRSIAIPEFYRTWQREFLQWLPDECDSRMMNLIWLMYGILKSGKVQLNLVARHIPLRAKKLSIVKRLERFLNNSAVRVRAWYEPVARRLLLSASQGGEVRLVVDGSRIAFGYQLLMVAVCYQGRAQPIAWSWVAHRQGHSRTRLQLALLHYVRQMLPTKVKVLLVGDSEFGAAWSSNSLSTGAGTRRCANPVTIWSCSITALAGNELIRCSAHPPGLSASYVG
jgi:hypothetical protein